MSTLARLNILVDAESAKRSLRSLEGVARRSAGVITGAFTRAIGVMRGMTRQIFSLKAAFISLGAGLVIRDFIKVANTLEQVRFQMVAVTKDTNIANKIFKNTRQFASEVSFSFEDLIGSSNRMAAQLKGNIKEVDFFLRAAADISAVSGLTMEESTNNLMRMLAAGAASADQFREKGVLAMLGFTAGVAYSADETKKKLVAAFQDGGSIVQGVAKQMSNTFTGTLSMIGDKIFDLKATVMEAGVFDFLKEAARVINEDLDSSMKFLKQNATQVGATITKFLKDTVLFAASAVDTIGNVINGIRNFFDVLSDNYNATNALTNNQIAGMGLVGYILFGAAGGLAAVAGGILSNLSNVIIKWLASTMASMMGLMRTQMESFSGSVNAGDLIGLSGAKGFKKSLSETIGYAYGGKHRSAAEVFAAAQTRAGESNRISKSPQETAGSYGNQLAGAHFYNNNMANIVSVLSENVKLLSSDQNPTMDRTTFNEFMGYVEKSGYTITEKGVISNQGFKNSLPIVGDLITKAYQQSFKAEETLKNVSPDIQVDTSGIEGIVNSIITDSGKFLTNQASGDRPTDSTFFYDEATSRLERMNLGPKFGVPDAIGPTGGTGGGLPPSSTATATGPATPLAAHVLQQQLTTVIAENIEKLKSGEMTFEKFNRQKELMTKLIAAEIPLVGALTTEQQKEKDGIIALFNQTKKYEKMLEKLGITYQDTANNISKGFLTAAALAGNTAEKTMQFGQQMYQSLENGLDSFITSGDFKFRNFMLNLAQQFLMMQAQLALSRLTTALFGGMLAGGGPVMPNRAYVVGERGREVFQPNQAGRMIPNNELGGGGVTIHQSFDFRNADQFTEARLRQQAAVIKESTRNSIYQDMQDGGSVSKISGRR